MPNTSERPADVFVPNYSFGKDLVLDVAITCPLQHKYLSVVSATAGFAEARVEQEGFMYLSFILETFGGFSDDVGDFIHRLSSNVATRLNDSKASTQKNMYEMISCVLMKSLATSVSSRFEEFCQSF